MPGDDLSGVIAALVAGEPAIVPTDTVFGIAVSPLHAPSPQVLYEVKGRPAGKPVAWLVASADDLDVYGADVPGYARRLAAAFWPGALTLVVKAGIDVPPEYRSQEGTIGLRMPDDVLVRVVCDEVGCPLAVTSANLSGRPAPRRFADIDPAIFAQVSAAIDDEQDKSGIASTVVDCTGPAYRIIREGALTRDDLDGALDAGGCRETGGGDGGRAT